MIHTGDIVVSVVGARPHFIKAFPLVRAMAKSRAKVVTVHTGQHYDPDMSGIFFEEFDMPPPDINLNVGSGTHAEQTAAVMIGTEKVLLELKPKAVVVYGDTNSTLGATLAAAKYYFPVVHVESGVRCSNRRMPEEINRRLIDHVSDYLICPSKLAADNLFREGITQGVLNVGDFMYDTFLFARSVALTKSDSLEIHGVRPREYILSTIHRELTTESVDTLMELLETLGGLGEPVILPMHPRTRRRLLDAGCFPEQPSGLQIIEPLGYLEMLQFLVNARKVITDSGGLQKEAYWAEVPCITLMEDTPWRETVDIGWNTLVGLDTDSLRRAVADDIVLRDHPDLYGAPGAAERTVQAMGWV